MDLVAFTEKILNGKLHFLYSEMTKYPQKHTAQTCKVKCVKLLEFANIKQRKKLSLKFQRILKWSPYKCQKFPDPKTLYYIVEFQISFENPS